jgi:SAM-dependent methyltransferase
MKWFTVMVTNTSPEQASITYVQWAYRTLLDRTIDPVAEQEWVVKLTNNLNISKYEVLASLFVSGEFYTMNRSINRMQRIQLFFKILSQLDQKKLTPVEYGDIAYRCMRNYDLDQRLKTLFEKGVGFSLFWKAKLFYNVFVSREYLKEYQRPRPFLRLHFARQEWVKNLPKATRVLDIGGSSPSLPEGALIELGYSHRPQEIVIFDKPPAEQFWGNPLYDQTHSREFAWGKVQYIHGYAEDLMLNDQLRNEKFDMIFMGQVVEHIQIAGLPVVFNWIKAHLQPGGVFCFDTPNRIVTKVQMGDDLYIDPDHKKEYTPAEIVTLMQENGFEVIQQKAILQMPNVQKNNSFGLEDYYDGQLLSDNPDEGYCFGTYAIVKT